MIFIAHMSALSMLILPVNHRHYDRAKDCFSKVLSIDSKNGDAYIGMELCANNVKNFDELIDKKREALQNVKSSTIFAVNTNSKVLEKAAEKYCKGGILSYSEIKKEYDFNSSFESLVPSLTDFLNKERSYWSTNQNIVQAKKYSSKERVENLIRKKRSFISEINDKLEEEKSKDSVKSEKIAKCYEELTNSTLNAEYASRAEVFYQTYCHSFNSMRIDSDKLTLESLKSLLQDFKKIEYYKDSKKYIDSINNAIQNILNAKLAYRIFIPIISISFILLLIIVSFVPGC